MAYTFDQIFAADPDNPANVARNATVLIFAPGDTAKTPLTLTTPEGVALANPVPVNGNGFGSAFMHATLDRVAWEGGGFTGFFTAYEGMKNEAIAAREAADIAAAAATAAADLVGAPADTAVETLINAPGSATKAALNATYGRTYDAKNYGAVGDGVADDRAAIQAACTAAAAAGGGLVYIPEGLYKMVRPSPTSTELVKLLDKVTLRGAGRDKTKLFLDPTTPTSTTGLVGIRPGHLDQSVADVVVEDIELNMNTSIINDGESSANQLWGISARFEGVDSPATLLLHADNITIRRNRILDSRIAISAAKTGASSATLDPDYFHRNWRIEDNEIDGIWNRSIEVAYGTEIGIRRNKLRGRGFLHVLSLCYMVWIEDNDIEYGRDSYSMDGTADLPGASAGPAGIYFGNGIHHVWMTRNYVRPHEFAGTAIAGCIQFRTENVAETFVMHHIYSTENFYSNTRATTKRVLDFNTQALAVSNTVSQMYFTRDYFEGVVKLHGGTSATLHLDDWQFDSCTFTEPLDTVDHATVDADDIRFVNSRLAGDQVVKLTNAEFDKCVFTGTLTLDAASANVEALNSRTASGTVTNSGTGNVVDRIRSLTATKYDGLFARKTARETVTSSDVLQNDDHLTVTVEANAVYRVEAALKYGAGTTGDFKFGFTAPAGATLDWGGGQVGTSGLSSESGSDLHSSKTLADTFTTGGIGATTWLQAHVVGLLVVSSTAGSFTLQWAQGVSDATATNLELGSWLRLARVA